MPQYDPLLPSFQRSLPTLSTLPSTRTSTPPPSQLSHPAVNHSPPIDPALSFQTYHPTAQPVSQPPPLSPSESRNRGPAGRSTLVSPGHKGAPLWVPPQAAGAPNIKSEEDDASLTAPGLSPSSPLGAPGHPNQPQQHIYAGHPSQLQYPQYLSDPVQFYPTAPPGPPSAPLSPPGGYPTHQQPPQYAYQQPQQSGFTSIAPPNQYHYSGQQQQQQPQPQSPASPHSPHSPNCGCRDCSGGGMMGSQPFPPFGWTQAPQPQSMGSGSLGNWAGPPLHQAHETSPTDRQGPWRGPGDAMRTVPFSPQQVGMPGMPPSQDYSPERATHSGDWTSSQFGYSVHPAQMQFPSSYPPSGHGPMSNASMSPTGSSVSWAVPQDLSSPPPEGPPSPSETKTDKPVKHKSRKTWTEVEWKKLTDLAERSKRGDPTADIDWDYVTNGFGGRRCRQGILTVAAKRGLKVSTREARTQGKRGRSAEDDD